MIFGSLRHPRLFLIIYESKDARGLISSCLLIHIHSLSPCAVFGNNERSVVDKKKSLSAVIVLIVASNPKSDDKSRRINFNLLPNPQMKSELSFEKEGKRECNYGVRIEGVSSLGPLHAPIAKNNQ